MNNHWEFSGTSALDFWLGPTFYPTCVEPLRSSNLRFPRIFFHRTTLLDDFVCPICPLQESPSSLPICLSLRWELLGCRPVTWLGTLALTGRDRAEIQSATQWRNRWGTQNTCYYTYGIAERCAWMWNWMLVVTCFRSWHFEVLQSGKSSFGSAEIIGNFFVFFFLGEKSWGRSFFPWKHQGEAIPRHTVDIHLCTFQLHPFDVGPKNGGTWRSNGGTTQGCGCEGQSLRGQPHPAAHGALVWEDSIMGSLPQNGVLMWIQWDLLDKHHQLFDMFVPKRGAQDCT